MLRAPVSKLETQDCWWSSSNLSLTAWEPAEPIVCVLVPKSAVSKSSKSKLMFQFKSKGWKNSCPSSQPGRRNPPTLGTASLFVLSRPSVIGWGLLGESGQSLLLDLSTQMLISSKHPHRTPKYVWPNIWAPYHSVKFSVKLTITVGT